MLRPTPTPQPLPEALQFSANESAIFGAQMYRAYLPSLGLTDGLALLEALMQAEADLCRITLPGEATESLATLAALQVPYGLFGVMHRCIVWVQPKFPDLAPDRSGGRYINFTQDDVPLVRQLIRTISPDTLDFNFADPVLTYLTPPEKRLDALVDFLCSYAHDDNHPERYGVLMKVGDKVAGYSAFNVFEDSVQGLVGGTLPEFRGLGLMQDMFHDVARRCQAWGPQFTHVWGDVHIQNMPQLRSLSRAHMRPEKSLLALTLSPLFSRTELPELRLPWAGPTGPALWQAVAAPALRSLGKAYAGAERWAVRQLTTRTLGTAGKIDHLGNNDQSILPDHTSNIDHTGSLRVTFPLISRASQPDRQGLLPETTAIVLVRAYDARERLRAYLYAHLAV